MQNLIRIDYLKYLLIIYGWTVIEQVSSFIYKERVADFFFHLSIFEENKLFKILGAP